MRLKKGADIVEYAMIIALVSMMGLYALASNEFLKAFLYAAVHKIPNQAPTVESHLPNYPSPAPSFLPMPTGGS